MYNFQCKLLLFLDNLLQGPPHPILLQAVLIG